MLNKITTKARKRLSNAFQGVPDLEEVESLEVNNSRQHRQSDVDDAFLGETSSAVIQMDHFHDVRRQVYAEALVYRTTPLYATKIALEQRVEEHRLLHAHLQALERSEENGPLLMPDELLLPDYFRAPSQETFSPLPHTPRGHFASLPPGVAHLRRSSSLNSRGAVGYAPVVSGVSHSYGDRDRRGDDLGSGIPCAAVRGRHFGMRPSEGTSSCLSHQPRRRQRGQVASPPPSGYSFRQPSPLSHCTTTRPSEEPRRAPAQAAGARRRRSGSGVARGVPRFPFFSSHRSLVPPPGAAGGPASPPPAGVATAVNARGADGEAKGRSSGWSSESDALADRDRDRPFSFSPKSFVDTPSGGSCVASVPLCLPAARMSQASVKRSKQRLSSVGDGLARDRRWEGAGHLSRVHHECLNPLPRGSSFSVSQAFHGISGRGVDRSERGAESCRLVCDTGGERHTLNWTDWIQRQRRRGWFANSALYFMTTLGAVMGAGTFTSFWSQLQTWKSLWFLVPYTLDFVFIGVPALHTEVLLGNLFRGTPVKCFTQISRWLVGAGLFTLVSTVIQMSLKAGQSARLLVYFLASWKAPHPWEVTAEDRQLCRSISNGQVCESAGEGTLCHWRGSPLLECLASPTGKATHFYFSRLEPAEIHSNVNPSTLEPTNVASISIVWAFVLAYIWKGLFKIGFMSALLVFMALVLCVALIVTCFMTAITSRHEEQPDYSAIQEDPLMGAPEDMWALRAHTLGAVLHDLTLGCGVYETVSSFSKIGYNVIPAANHLALIDYKTTGVSFYDLVRKTRNAPAYYVIFPAAFDRVSASNVFAMFFYGGIFILNIQVTAIAIHSVINVFEESRIVQFRWRQQFCVGLVMICFILSLTFCSNDQQRRHAFFAFLISFLFTPCVVFLESISIGWIHNATYQERVAGRLAVRVYAGCCALVAVGYGFIALAANGTFYLPIFVMLPINAGLAALTAYLIHPPEASSFFQVRFRALFLGNVELFKEQVLRVTLFTRPPSPAVAWLFSMLRMMCGCLFSKVKPFYLSRISIAWCVLVKHVLPQAMVGLLAQGLRDFPRYWQLMSTSPHVRHVGIATVVFAYLVLFLAPVIPKLRWWVCPPPEDYMPAYMFPVHVYRPPRVPPLGNAVARLFAEFSASSRTTSRFLYSVVADYKRQHVCLRRATAPRAIDKDECDRANSRVPRYLLSRRTDRTMGGGTIGELSATQSRVSSALAELVD
ncbi:hypothetical protein BESB_022870 [Besnoitia besnoiti]|uniref:Sodium:neurotransmitter symporter family protein n=1 Tax=Besnoitia besnoiti TaxID=94643 RepID=A0A2A9M1D1_BESBE|nr:hypothetical protein BESB_022870 [Besnoitia besnoiti]PFH31795.1 hypothetical protein BESB_022870 [Besnoitia besnoiti]